VIELDDRLRSAQGVCRELARDLRTRALAVDADPDAIEQHFDSPAFDYIRRSTIPAEYLDGGGTGRPDQNAGIGPALGNAVTMTELAQGDAAMVLACPSPALAGVFVELLGSPEQRDRFYGRVRDGRSWAFFAMTEPARGNDATALETRIERDGAGGWLLSGAKRYIGNGARGSVGVVWGRTGPSVLSVRAALVEVPAAGWQASRLDMVGLRGAALSELSLDRVPVAADMLLGQHLPATRRGIWGAIRTFNNMRIQIASFAVGTALAIADYVGQEYKGARDLELTRSRVRAAREMLFQSAARLDADPDRGYLASVAKLGATREAVRTAHWAAAALGPAGLVEHPLLEKWGRDVCAFEFMDGTSNIQRLNVAHGYQAGDCDETRDE
jgi:alkylation response protein AidB-like acyl-CoA dehydrogenase